MKQHVGEGGGDGDQSRRKRVASREIAEHATMPSSQGSKKITEEGSASSAGRRSVAASGDLRGNRFRKETIEKLEPSRRIFNPPPYK